MRTIWKFALDLKDEQTVEMPQDSDLLDVQDQGGLLMLWANVDPEAHTVKRLIRTVGTGYPIPDELLLTYVATVQQASRDLVSRNLVWHVFDKGESCHS